MALVVQATAGSSVPPLRSTTPYSGSYTDLVLQSGGPMLVSDLARAERSCAACAVSDAAGSAIVVPLAHTAGPVGALFVVGPPGQRFDADDVDRARTFGHLAALAYEKVRLLDEAREGRRELERVMKSRSRLMRGFSHDVKNPLGAADGYAELLAADIYGPLSAEQRESVERLRRAIQCALALIDDLHDLARSEADHVMLSPRPVDLGELLRASGEEYRAAARARGLSLSVEPAAEALIVETDQVRVRQIVSNLLSNAIKYTPSGSVALRVQRCPLGPDGDAADWAAVEVVDTGPGIPATAREIIFEEFVRLGTGDRSGAGLGLAISQRLAHALGGRITVQSEVGRGSTFTLWLPLRRKDGAAATDDPVPGTDGEARESGLEPEHGITPRSGSATPQR